jgi:hypothetical protein
MQFILNNIDYTSSNKCFCEKFVEIENKITIL